MKIDLVLRMILVALITVFIALSINFAIGQSHAASSLKAPKNFKVKKIKKTSVDLTWNKVSGATGYELYMKNRTTGKSYKTKYKGASKTSVTRGNMTSGNSYTFKVRAYKTKKKKTTYSSYSKSIGLRTKYIYAPSKVSVKNKVRTAIRITWSKVTDADGYVVSVYNSSKKKIAQKTLSKNKNEYVKTKLKPDTQYTFKVRSYKKINGKKKYSSYTPALKVRTNPLPEDTSSKEAVNEDVNNETVYENEFETSEVISSETEDENESTNTNENNISVNAPTNLKVKGSTGNSITFSWNTVQDATGYEFYVKNYETDETKENDLIGSTVNSITLSDFEAGTAYAMYLKAYKTVNGEKVYSRNSNGIKITVKKVAKTNTTRSNGVTKKSTSSSSSNTSTKPKTTKVTVSIPTKFKVAKIGYDYIKIDWNNVSGATGYNVIQYNHSTKKTKSYNYKSSVAKRTNLSEGTTYTYKVRAYKTVNGKKYYSKYTNTLKVTTKKDESYKKWKQCDKRWGSKSLGGNSVCRIGCAATSIAILVKQSGVKTNLENFTPGTFVTAMKKKGGFTSGGAIYWNKTSKVAPKFVLAGDIKISGSKSKKVKKIKSLLNKGYYLTMQVKAGCGRGSHFVAIDRVKGSTVYMNDPASSSTVVTKKYSSGCWNRIVYFKKK